MNSIATDLELTKYSNNNQEHYTNLVKYMKSHYPLIQMNIVNKSDNEKQFSMTFEGKTLNGDLTY